jgi:hypothetical protein
MQEVCGTWNLEIGRGTSAGSVTGWVNGELGLGELALGWVRRGARDQSGMANETTSGRSQDQQLAGPTERYCARASMSSMWRVPRGRTTVRTITTLRRRTASESVECWVFR